ncbi:MAG: hypothetical protein V3T86_05785 [Planctomycetota bacterium]
MSGRLVALLCLVGIADIVGADAAEEFKLSDARARVDRLRGGLRDKDVETDALRELLKAAHEPYGNVVADPLVPKVEGVEPKDWEVRAHEKEFLKARKKWRRALQDALLDAMTVTRLSGEKKDKRNDHSVVNLRAAFALRNMPSGASRAIIVRFERHYMKIKGYIADPAVFEAVFDTLAKRNERGSFLWLRDDVMNEDARPQYRQRTEAALMALVQFPRVPGRKRNKTVRLLITKFEFIERQADFDGYGDMQALTGRKHTSRAKKKYWKTVGPLVIAALMRFCTDPITKTEPVDYKRKEPLKLVADFARWFGRNKRIAYAPWRDPKEWKRKPKKSE